MDESQSRHEPPVSLHRVPLWTYTCHLRSRWASAWSNKLGVTHSGQQTTLLRLHKLAVSFRPASYESDQSSGRFHAASVLTFEASIAYRHEFWARRLYSRIFVEASDSISGPILETDPRNRSWRSTRYEVQSPRRCPWTEDSKRCTNSLHSGARMAPPHCLPLRRS